MSLVKFSGGPKCLNLLHLWMILKCSVCNLLSWLSVYLWFSTPKSWGGGGPKLSLLGESGRSTAKRCGAMKTCPSTFGFSPKANAWLVIEFHRFKLTISSYLFNTSPQLAIATYFQLYILYKSNQQAFLIWYSFHFLSQLWFFSS